MGPTRPAIPSIHPDLFVDADPPRLVAGRCPACQRLSFPRQEACPYCAEASPRPEEVGGAGRLWAFTAVTAAPPGYAGPVPYGFGVVELDAGLRVVGRLTENDPARLRGGQPMELRLVELEAEGGPVLTYAFAPVQGGPR